MLLDRLTGKAWQECPKKILCRYWNKVFLWQIIILSRQCRKMLSLLQQKFIQKKLMFQKMCSCLVIRRQKLLLKKQQKQHRRYRNSQKTSQMWRLSRPGKILLKRTQQVLTSKWQTTRQKVQCREVHRQKQKSLSRVKPLMVQMLSYRI